MSELPCSPPGDLPHPGIKARSPALQADSLPSESPGKPIKTGVGSLSLHQGIFLTLEPNPGLLHCKWILYQLSYQGSPGGTSGKESACQCRRRGFHPRVGRSPGGRKGYPLEYSYLENPLDREAWQATVHGVTEADTTEVTLHACTESWVCAEKAVGPDIPNCRGLWASLFHRVSVSAP